MTVALASSVVGRVMGTTAEIIAVGVDAEPLLAEVARLERCWSRFLPSSELSRCGDVAGDVTVVSDDLALLVGHLVAARDATGGRVDPTLGAVMVDLGYDRTYARLVDLDPDVDPAHDVDRARVASPPAGRSERSIEWWPAVPAIRLAPGVRLDAGALGKGLAADLVAEQAVANGATGVLVDLGGDVVVRGVAPDGGPWRVEVPAGPERAVSIVELHDGAVATSDTGVRRWRRDGRVVGHVVDPVTGRSVDRHLRATVVAGAGWWAEAAATAALVSTARGDAWVEDLRRTGSVTALWVDDLGGDVDD